MKKSILVASSLFYLSTSLFGWSLNSVVEDAVGLSDKKTKEQKVKKEKNKEDEWKNAGFGRNSTAAWKQYVSNASEAQSWIKALGFSYTNMEFKAGMRGKYKDPQIANEWIKAGFTPNEASTWNKLGMGPAWSKAKKDKGLSPEEASKVEDDELVGYFNSIKLLPSPSYKKGEITFAGMGKHMGFYNMIKKVCKVSSFTTIDGYPKDEYCAENSKLAQPLAPKPKEFFKMKSWGKKYTHNALTKTKVKDETVILTNIQSQTIVAKPLTLKGVDFEVHFSYKGDRNGKVLAGMLFDGKVPMTYYTVPKQDRTLNRFVTFLYLDKIKLVPINENLYFDQGQELFNMFKKKFPKLKTSTRSLHTYSNNGDKFQMLFDSRSHGDRFIVYKFNNRSFGAKYLELYTKKQKEKLAQKPDDSESI